jgi:hypothetical protein
MAFMGIIESAKLLCSSKFDVLSPACAQRQPSTNRIQATVANRENSTLFVEMTVIPAALNF